MFAIVYVDVDSDSEDGSEDDLNWAETFSCREDAEAVAIHQNQRVSETLDDDPGFGGSWAVVVEVEYAQGQLKIKGE